MQFVSVSDSFDHSAPPAWYAEGQRRIAECAARQTGHLWTVEGDRGECPWLSCADCAADGADVYPDIIDILDDGEFQLGGRTIRFGEELPDNETSVFVIPVSVKVEANEHHTLNGHDWDVAIHVVDRSADL
ncbi:hypothetical protein [Nonomuraea maheshkhaliensis]|uniref:hypothetical protein n=1 Tax=Nonomuraea maheshkhaliensis TaxID=419590 RepID=UPI0031F8746C